MRRTKERRPCGFFTKMSDEELLEYCFRLHGKNVTRGKLTKDVRLYQKICERKLIDQINLSKRPNGFFWIQ